MRTGGQDRRAATTMDRRQANKDWRWEDRRQMTHDRRSGGAGETPAARSQGERRARYPAGDPTAHDEHAAGRRDHEGESRGATAQ